MDHLTESDLRGLRPAPSPLAPSEWVWMPHAGHFICGRDCQFHLNTYIGGYIVSTVGEYLPDSKVREILADTRGVKLEGRGYAREADFLRKLGYEKIGADRLYETMVFRAGPADDACCPWRMESGTNLDFAAYNDAGEARLGHLDLCRKWAGNAGDSPPPSDPPNESQIEAPMLVKRG